MTEQKQTSTERVKAYQARKKEFKQALANKGYVEVALIVKEDQVFKINNAAKMLKKPAPQLLYSITQRAIAEFCQKHDDILIHNALAQNQWLSDFIEGQDLDEILNKGVTE